MDERQIRLVQENLDTLKENANQERRRLERLGGIALSVASLLVAAVFLVVLKISPKQAIDVIMTFTAIVISLALFGLGLKKAIIG